LQIDDQEQLVFDLGEARRGDSAESLFNLLIGGSQQVRTFFLERYGFLN
jgi:hypothetical protein